jgi:leucyl aminopeptidase
MAAYEIGQFKSKKEEQHNLTLSFASTKAISKAIEEGKATGETINKVKSLIDAPSNHKTPDFLGRWAMDAAKQGEYKCTVLDKDKLEKQGFGAVLAVGQGSANPPVVIVMEYKAKPRAKMDIGLVGKGITFDT